MVDGPGHKAQLLKLVAPIRHLGGDLVVLALVGEGLLPEGLENDLHLLFEQLPVGVPVQHRRTEGLDLAGVVAAPYAEHNPAVGQDVGHGEVFRQPQRVPHRCDVEAAAELQTLGLGGQVQVEHQQVGDALVPLRLEVVLGHPELVVTLRVQELGYVQGPIRCLRKPFVGVQPVVRRRPLEPKVVVNNMSGV